jgi:multidrug efflux pump
MNKVIKTSISLAAGISFFFVGFFYLFTRKMIQIFINNKEVISYGIQITRAMIIALPLLGIQFLIRVPFQALGKRRPAFILALARDLFYIPILFILNKYFGFSGFIYAQPFAHVFTFLLTIALFSMIKGHITDKRREWENKSPRSSAAGILKFKTNLFAESVAFYTLLFLGLLHICLLYLRCQTCLPY